MRSPRFYFIAGIATCIGAAFVLLLLLAALNPLLTLSFFAAKSADWRIVKTVPSPNGEYAATLCTVSGGGAAGWCEQRVEINSKDDPFKMERTKKADNFSFSASCGSDVEIAWESDSALRISYSLDEAGVSTYQRAMAYHQPVKISYVAK